MSWLTVSTLRKTVKTVTRQDRLWLPTESFRLSSVEISVENESSRIDFYQFDDDHYSIAVFDKEFQKSVSLDFWKDSEVNIFVHFFKEKRTLAFWKKPSLQITKTIYVDVNIEDENNDENIKFVWDRVPEFLINLR